MLILLIGILSSIASEIVTALNKRLAGTVLKGDGAFLVAITVALIGSAVKVFFVDGTPLPTRGDFKSWQTLGQTFGTVWTISQMYFILVMQKLGLDVPSTPQPAPQPATAILG